jgi:hypothetical protein
VQAAPGDMLYNAIQRNAERGSAKARRADSEFD